MSLYHTVPLCSLVDNILMAGKTSLVDFPPEIISKIFIDCLPQWMSFPSQTTRPPIVFDPYDAPLLLMQICRRWRLIAEATPTLWSRLPNTRSAGALELYKMYIRNSGEAPLWAHLNSGDAEREAADILIPHSHRWEHLTLIFRAHLDAYDRGSMKISNLPDHLPSLKHLDIRQTYPSIYREVNLYRLPKFIAPRLQSVSVSSSRVLGLNIPWSQLTHYSGEFHHWQDTWTFLSLCATLEVLHFRTPRVKQPLSVPKTEPSLIHLPRLRELSLVNTRTPFNYYDFLISFLIFPALETVFISVDYDYPVLEVLCRCVAQSSLGEDPRLRSVEVQCPQSLTQPDLQELSLVAPGIQELRICRPSSEALLAMKFHPTNPFLFPCLEYLTLIDPLLTDYALVDIIMSRCHPPPSSRIRLRHVEIVFVEEPAPEILATNICGMVQPLHEAFQDVAECFTDDPSFKQMCGELKSALTVRTINPSSQKHQLPSHWDKLMDPLQCFLEFSDAVLTFFESYEVRHPLLLSRHQAVPLLREFLRGNLSSDSLLRAHRPEFVDRADALLDKWQPMIDEYSEKERWVIEGVDETYPLAEECAYKVVYCTFG